jgi:hypothetical protein
MPPAWVDFCWVLVREKCDDIKQISVVVGKVSANDEMTKMVGGAPNNSFR